MTSATIATSTSLSTSASPRTAGFLDTLSSEWFKLISLRSTHITAALGVLLSVATTALVAVAVGSAGGKVRGDRHIVAAEWTPVANLWLRISDLYGARLDTFAESTGRVEI